jgi:hypothetical protein
MTRKPSTMKRWFKPQLEEFEDRVNSAPVAVADHFMVV